MSIQWGEAIMRRQKDDRRVDLASRGTMQRWCRISSRVRPQGCPESLGGASLVKPVWLKNSAVSRCVAVIVAEQSTEALPPHHGTCLATNCPLPCNQLVVETLMIAFCMIVGQVLVDGVRQRLFTQ